VHHEATRDQVALCAGVSPGVATGEYPARLALLTESVGQVIVTQEECNIAEPIFNVGLLIVVFVARFRSALWSMSTAHAGASG
jgi:hypothetical protein